MGDTSRFVLRMAFLNRSGCRTLAPKSTAPDLSLKSTKKKNVLTGWDGWMAIGNAHRRRRAQKQNREQKRTPSTAAAKKIDGMIR